MPSTGLLAQGTKLKAESPVGSSTFVAITNNEKISFKPPQPEQVDFSNLDSDAREYKSGLRGQGEVTFTLQYNPADASHVILRANANASDPRNYQIVLPDVGNETINFTATTYFEDLGAEAGGKLLANVKLTISALPDWP